MSDDPELTESVELAARFLAAARRNSFGVVFSAFAYAARQIADEMGVDLDEALQVFGEEARALEYGVEERVQ
jgi:hypothetical protein